MTRATQTRQDPWSCSTLRHSCLLYTSMVSSHLIRILEVVTTTLSHFKVPENFCLVFWQKTWKYNSISHLRGGPGGGDKPISENLLFKKNIKIKIWSITSYFSWRHKNFPKNHLFSSNVDSILDVVLVSSWFHDIDFTRCWPAAIILIIKTTHFYISIMKYGLVLEK